MGGGRRSRSGNKRQKSSPLAVPLPNLSPPTESIQLRSSMTSDPPERTEQTELASLPKPARTGPPTEASPLPPSHTSGKARSTYTPPPPQKVSFTPMPIPPDALARSPSTHTAIQSSGTNARNLQLTPPHSHMPVTLIRVPRPLAYGPYHIRQGDTALVPNSPHLCRPPNLASLHRLSRLLLRKRRKAREAR